MSDLHSEDPRKFPVVSLCRLFGKTKQAFYKHDGTRALQFAELESYAVEFVREIRARDPGIGGKKLWHMYCQAFKDGPHLGRDRFADVLDKYSLKARRRFRKPRTTDSTHGLPVYPNLVKDYIPQAPNKLWVSDITYLTLNPDSEHCEFCYLSLILDSYSKEIVGWSLGPTLGTDYPLQALEMALKRLKGLPAGSVDLIHHSDRGSQYASARYVSKLRASGIRISMTESGDPKDNAQAERINNTVKNELLKNRIFKNLKEAEAAVAEAVRFYNEERPHMSINMMTPKQASLCEGDIPKKWKSYREDYLRGRQDACSNPEEGSRAPSASSPSPG